MVQELEPFVYGSSDSLTSQEMPKIRLNKKIFLLSTGCITVVMLAVGYLTGVEQKPDYADLWTKKLPQNCGQRTNQSEFPWIVSVLHERHKGALDMWYIIPIMGTLISKRYVISGSYTLVRRFKFPDSTEKFIVLLDISNMPHSVKGKAKLKNFTHRNVVSEKSRIAAGNNFALLRLDSDVEFNDGIQPICLPGVHKTSVKSLPSQLEVVVNVNKKYEVTIVTDFAKCIPANCTRITMPNSTDDRICTLNDNIFLQFARSREGAPLFTTMAEYGTQRTTQYGMLNNEYCTSNMFIFINLSYYMEWILETIDL